MPFQPLTPAEFIERTSTEKVRLMDELNANMHSIGFELASISRAYYKIHIGYKHDESEEERNLKAEMEYYKQQYKTLEDNISALQSTLKAEREMLRDNNSEQ